MFALVLEAESTHWFHSFLISVCNLFESFSKVTRYLLM